MPEVQCTSCRAKQEVESALLLKPVRCRTCQMMFVAGQQPTPLGVFDWLRLIEWRWPWLGVLLSRMRSFLIVLVILLALLLTGHWLFYFRGRH